MHRSLADRLADLDARISTLEADSDGDESAEVRALLAQLTWERRQVQDALDDVTLIDDEPFDLHAIEVGDTVTVVDSDGEVERYVLVDDTVGIRAQSDWVSISSPLGKALLGRSKGEEVEVESPQGPLVYGVVDFERRSDGGPLGGSGGHVHPSLPSEAFVG